MPRSHLALDRTVALTALVLLPSFASPLVGTHAFGVSALLLLVLLMGRAARSLDHNLNVASVGVFDGGLQQVYEYLADVAPVGMHRNPITSTGELFTVAQSRNHLARNVPLARPSVRRDCGRGLAAAGTGCR